MITCEIALPLEILCGCLYYIYFAHSFKLLNYKKYKDCNKSSKYLNKKSFLVRAKLSKRSLEQLFTKVECVISNTVPKINVEQII